MRYQVPGYEKNSAIELGLNQETSFFLLWKIRAMIALNIRDIIDIIFINFWREKRYSISRSVDGTNTEPRGTDLVLRWNRFGAERYLPKLTLFGAWLIGAIII